MNNTKVNERPARLTASKRLEARVSSDLKCLFEQAAALQGITLSDFIISSARQAALKTLQDHQTLILNAEDTQKLVTALLNPPAPGQRLQRAARRYKQFLLAE
jgi:uncharacterized protein (DUF1778 family)